LENLKTIPLVCKLFNFWVKAYVKLRCEALVSPFKSPEMNSIFFDPITRRVLYQLRDLKYHGLLTDSEYCQYGARLGAVNKSSYYVYGAILPNYPELLEQAPTYSAVPTSLLTVIGLLTHGMRANIDCQVVIQELILLSESLQIALVKQMPTMTFCMSELFKHKVSLNVMLAIFTFCRINVVIRDLLETDHFYLRSMALLYALHPVERNATFGTRMYLSAACRKTTGLTEDELTSVVFAHCIFGEAGLPGGLFDRTEVGKVNELVAAFDQTLKLRLEQDANLIKEDGLDAYYASKGIFVHSL
jgi:hypothetical protein